MLPPMTPEGRLPVGRHPATLEELRERFVDLAPNSERRNLIFRALLLYIDVIAPYFPDARLWINGGFVTHKPEAPADVDVVIVSDPAPSLTVAEVASVHTLHNVTSTTEPFVAVERLQPFGGLIDGFVASPRIPEVLAFWEDQWSKVKDGTDTERKGFVEVIL